jgi:hypothetical protein
MLIGDCRLVALKARNSRMPVRMHGQAHSQAQFHVQAQSHVQAQVQAQAQAQVQAHTIAVSAS